MQSNPCRSSLFGRLCFSNRWSTLGGREARRKRRGIANPPVPAEVEKLEDRLLLASNFLQNTIEIDGDFTVHDSGIKKFEPNNPEIVVNTHQDGVNQIMYSFGLGDTDLSTPGNQVSLRSAVQFANSSIGNDTIRLAAGHYELTRTGTGEDWASTGDLDIRGNLTIKGAGAGATFIDANDLDRVFQVLPGVALTLEGVTVKGGNGGTYGGGVYNEGQLTLNGADITHNEARYGGGIYNKYGDVSVVNHSNISHNDAVYYGGGIYNVGDRMTKGNVTVDLSVLQGNEAKYGGAIFNSRGDVHVVHDSEVAQNEAWYGGAIYNYGNRFSTDSDLFISDSDFYENHATRNGGAIYNHANLTVNASSRFYWNTAEYHGGAIYNAFFGTADISDRTELWENSTRYGSGGAIFNSGVLQMDTTDLARNAASTDSGSTGYGGAIYNEGQMTLSNVQAEDNTADQGNHFYQKNAAGATTTATNVSSQTGGNFNWHNVSGLTGVWVVD